MIRPNGPSERERPLWQTLGTLVAFAWLAHAIVVHLVEKGLAPSYTRGASLSLWSIAVVSWLVLGAVRHSTVRRRALEWSAVFFGYLVTTSLFLIPVLSRMWS